MCVAYPGTVIEVRKNEHRALVDFSGTTVEAQTMFMDVEPGDIVVMHDGQYDCSATAAALRRALPKLKERGFSFITIDELMRYPAKEES